MDRSRLLVIAAAVALVLAVVMAVVVVRSQPATDKTDYSAGRGRLVGETVIGVADPVGTCAGAFASLPDASTLDRNAFMAACVETSTGEPMTSSTS